MRLCAALDHTSGAAPNFPLRVVETTSTPLARTRLLATQIKTAAERTLVRTGAPRLVRRRVRETTLILAYHNVVADGTAPGGDASLHLPLSCFCEQLDQLEATHEVVPLERALVRPGGERPQAVITFDDAYRGAVLLGVEELAKRGLPATMFVAPAFVPDGSFWWDAAGPGLSAELRERMLTDHAGRDGAVRAQLERLSGRQHDVGEGLRVASEAELERALERHPGLTLGAHSWSHPNLTRLGDAELAQELARPLAWLRARFPRVLPWLAYPYGLTDARVVVAAVAAGYAGGVVIGGGRMRPGANRFTMPRLNIPAAVSREGFALRLGGMLGQ